MPLPPSPAPRVQSLGVHHLSESSNVLSPPGFKKDLASFHSLWANSSASPGIEERILLSWPPVARGAWLMSSMTFPGLFLTMHLDFC